jgi:PHP family Zn ribbon phosphoesterase
MATGVWWVCTKCGTHVIKKGAKRVLEALLAHRKVCDPLACFSLKKVT